MIELDRARDPRALASIALARPCSQRSPRDELAAATRRTSLPFPKALNSRSKASFTPRTREAVAAPLRPFKPS